MTRGSKGLPKLESLLTRATRRRQSMDEMRTAVDAISKAYKLPLQKRKKARGQ